MKTLLAAACTALLLAATTARFVVPPQLANTPLGASLAAAAARQERPASATTAARAAALETQYLDVPLDHFPRIAGDKRKLKLRYWIVNASWDGRADAPIILDMPGEGGVGGAPGNYASNLTGELRGLEIRTEHRCAGCCPLAAAALCACLPACLPDSCVRRFFGSTLYQNSSSTDYLQFLSVEQNLADLADLVQHVKKSKRLTGKVVAVGGSYSGASTCWLRCGRCSCCCGCCCCCRYSCGFR